MAGWERGWLTWPAARTLVPCWHMPRRTRSRPRPPWRRTSAMRAYWRTPCGLFARLSARLKQGSLAAGTITLKLKTADFRLRTRSRRVADPTQLADTLYHIASGLLAAEV